MGLGNIEKEKTRKSYLTINDGKVIIDKGKGRKASFSFVEGYLEGIYKKDSTFNGEKVTRWYIDIRDGVDIYSICLPYSSGVFKSIILALASDKELNSSTPIRIEPYIKGGYTKAIVYSSGVKLDWITKELPPVTEIMVGEKKIKDDSKRMEFISNLCNTIIERLISK